MIYLRLFLRGFAIVAVTAANVAFIGRHAYGQAFATGGLLSWLWYANVGHAADSRDGLARLAYATGAGAGTVLGMWIGGAF